MCAVQVVGNISFWLITSVAGLISVVIFLFFLLQVIDEIMKNGFTAGMALVFTSFIIFPITCVLELFSNSDYLTTAHKQNSDLFVGPHDMLLLDGLVYHKREEQAVNTFTYHVQYAIIDLDHPPHSFNGDYLNADQAREMAHTDGPVLLLTAPSSMGYHQNPISLYYCFARGGGLLHMCLAEVTNTPWGERVTFPFLPSGDSVPKSLHVSPFLDMQRCWLLHASVPGRFLPTQSAFAASAAGAGAGACFVPEASVSVAVTVLAAECPADLADLSVGGDGGVGGGGAPPFIARMVLRPSRVVRKGGGGGSVGGGVRGWFMPQRIALRIYWQAMRLLAKGVRYCPHPRDADAAAYAQACGPLEEYLGRRVEGQKWMELRGFLFLVFFPGFNRIFSLPPPQIKTSTAPSILSILSRGPQSMSHWLPANGRAAAASSLGF